MSATRRRTRKVTGRFAAFVAIVVVLIIGIVLGIRFATRGSENRTASNNPTATPDAQIGAEGDASANLENEYAQFATAIINDGDDPPMSTPVPESELIHVAENDLSITPGLPSEWRNVLLLGQDVFDYKNRGNGRADTMMILSMNQNTGEVKLCSLQRDIIVTLPNNPDKPQRLNAANMYGGPALTMKIVNEKFGMNITEYVMVNFSSFPLIVEKLGGVTLYVTEAEWKMIKPLVGNAVWNDSIAQLETGRPMPDLDNTLEPETWGMVKLTGRQALAYARIRHLDTDFRRSERQRNVIKSILEEVKDADISTLGSLAAELYPYVKTNITINGMLSLAFPVLQNGANVVDESRLPRPETYVGGKREGMEAMWDIDFEANAKYLREFIYGS